MQAGHAPKITFYLIQPQFLTLLLINGSGSVQHHIAACIVFREGNEIADGIAATEQGAESVEAECDTSVRRCAVFERTQQKPKFFVGFFLAEAEGIEHAFLNVALENANGAAADFCAIEHEVIRIGFNVGILAAVHHPRQVFGFG